MRPAHRSAVVPPPLPETIRIKTGSLFVVPANGQWQPAGARSSINVGLLDGSTVAREEGTRTYVKRATVFHPELVHVMKLHLARLLEGITLKGMANYLYSYVTLERWLFDAGGWERPGSFRIEDLTPQVYNSFRVHVNTNDSQRGQKAGCVRKLYEWALSERYGGFRPEVFEQIKDMKLEKALAGVAARWYDPVKGPLSYEEQLAVADAVVEGASDISSRVTTQICRETGIRPEALVRLRRRHFVRERGIPVLYVPRVKQRSGAKERSVRWVITELLASLLTEMHLGMHDDDNPLVPTWDNREPTNPSAFVSAKLRRLVSDACLVTLRVPPNGVALAPPSDDEALVSDPYHLFGPFAPTPLKLTASRFRRTVATRLCEEGHPPEVVAAMLDDETLEMALVYAEASDRMVTVLAETLDKQPEWLRIVRLFRGEITSETGEDLPEIWGGIEWLADYDGVGDFVIGRCAKQGDCELRQPVSCYCCDDFRADPDAPHERQLQQIRSEIKRGEGRESDRVVGANRRSEAAILQLIEFIRNEVVGRPPTVREIMLHSAKRPAGVTNLRRIYSERTRT